MKYFLVACFVALTVTDAPAEPIVDMIGSKTYWQAMDWENAEKSEIWQMSGWSAFEGKQDNYQTFTKLRPANIDGKQFTAYLLVIKTPKLRDALSLSSIELLADECIQVYDWLAAKFGDPQRVVDGSYKYDLIAAGNTVEITDKTFQWDIGSTRATFSCAGIKPRAKDISREKNRSSGILSFGSKDTEREVKPLFGLRCTQWYKIIGLDEAPKNGDDLAVIIDENKNRVLRANKDPLPGQHRITEDVIEVKTMASGTIIEFSINRHTGAFNGKSLIPKGGVNMFGQCEKIAAGERKF